ncbi:TPA: hypothetical protein I9097_001417 [Clostridium perfringens]|nr:hypothetical protein [Clostridium perfringens]
MKKYKFSIIYLIVSIILVGLPILFSRVFEDMIRSIAKDYNMSLGFLYTDLAIFAFFMGILIIVLTMLFCNYMKIKKMGNVNK